MKIPIWPAAGLVLLVSQLSAQPQDALESELRAGIASFPSQAKSRQAAGLRDQRSWAGFPTAIDRSQVYWSQDLDGISWARGADFKASFEANGFTFIPYLGAQAPKNYPVALTLESVQIGADSLGLTSKSQPARDDNFVTWDRGGIEERVEVSTGHLEQSFAIPAGTYQGPITLRIGVRTELRAQREEAGLLFRNDLGGVRYSGAVAFDESGTRVEIPSEWEDGTIVIHVPGSFVNQAKGEIVVDPILSTFQIDGLSSGDLTHPDVAYDFQGDRYLVAMRERFSGSDYDIFSWLLNGADGTQISGRYLFGGTRDYGPPSVAFHGQTQSFMTVTGESNSSTGLTQILAINYSSVTTNVGSIYLIESSATATVPVSAPVIGGDHWASGVSYYCVAWMRINGSNAAGVYAIYDGAGNRVSGPTLIQPSPMLPDSKLCISKSTGNSGFTSYWQLAWQESGPGSGQVSLKTRRIDYAGVFKGNVHNVRTNPQGATFDHIAVSDLLQYQANSTRANALITFGISGGGTLSSLWTSIAWDASGGQALQMYNVLDRTTEPYEDCVIATTNDHWILAWRVPGNRLFAAVGQPVGNALGMSEGRFLVTDPGVPLADLAICSTASGGGPTVWSDAMLTWSQGSSSPDIHGARVFALRDQTAGKQYCRGWPNSTGREAYMTAIGNRLHDQSQQFRTTHMPPNVFGYYIGGTMPTSIQFPGGSRGYLCVGGAFARFNRMGEVRHSGSTGSFSLDMDPTSIPYGPGSAPAMAGQTLYFQTWFRDTVSGSPTSNFSAALRIPFQ